MISEEEEESQTGQGEEGQGGLGETKGEHKSELVETGKEELGPLVNPKRKKTWWQESGVIPRSIGCRLTGLRIPPMINQSS